MGTPMIRKIALIEPVTDIPNIYSLFIAPRLGLLTLATALRQEGYDVDLYNDQIRKPRRRDLLGYDLIGISILTSTALRGYALARMVGEARPVVFGGYHATFLPEEALEHGRFAVRGEGEDTLLSLIRALNDGSSLAAIPGLSFRDGGQIRHNADRSPVEHYLRLSPAYDSVKGLNQWLHAPVLRRLFRLRFFPGTHTSRGCPHNCRYCTVIGMAGRKPRYRDMDLCVEELRRATTMARKNLFIADDNLTMNMPRAKEFLRRLIAAKIPKRYKFTTQIEVAAFRDDELLALLREANFTLLHVGYESVSEETLRNWNKSVTREQMLAPSRAAAKHNLRLNGMFVVGSDCDTQETIPRTVDFAIESNLAAMQMWILTPLPGSQVHRETSGENRVFNAYWKHYDCQHSTLFPRKIRPSTLQRAVREANRRFYSLARIRSGPGSRLTYALNVCRTDGWMGRYAQALRAVEDRYYEGETLVPERLAAHRPEATTAALCGSR